MEDLSEKSYIPLSAQRWVDHTREKGSGSNHEIKIMTKEEVHDPISFIEMLLRIVYGFPANIHPYGTGGRRSGWGSVTGRGVNA